MSNTAEKIESADDFLRGQADCRDGRPCPAGESRDYERGYSAQYQHEQNMTARCERNGC